MKENDIYPKFEFRLSHKDKEWLKRELDELKIKFNDFECDAIPVTSKSTLILAALKHGIRHLKSCQKIQGN